MLASLVLSEILELVFKSVFRDISDDTKWQIQINNEVKEYKANIILPDKNAQHYHIRIQNNCSFRF